MNISILEHSNEAIELNVKEIPLAFLNIIRRYALAKVPTYAIDEVMVVVNTSSMFDEILVHRLALIPLKTEDVIDKIRSVDPEICATCMQGEENMKNSVCRECYIHMILEAEATTSDVTVYSGDIRSEDPYVVPAYNNMPIVILAPGQRLSLELRARLGRGLEHAKWSPTTIAITKYVADIKINKNLCNLCGECVKACPKNVLMVKDGEISITSLYGCILCKQCVNVCPSRAIDITHVEGEYIMRIESAGSLKPETIVREAVNILLNELNEFEKFINNIKQGNAS